MWVAGRTSTLASVAILLWAGSTSPAKANAANDPPPALDHSSADRLAFEMAVGALDSGERHLAAEILGQLQESASGASQRYYSALLSIAGGRAEEAHEELERIFSEPAGASLADWLATDLIERIAEGRLARSRDENARRVEEALSRHFEARGGLEHLRSLTNMVVMGEIRTQNVVLPFRLVRKRPLFYRLDVFTPEGPVIEATNGLVSWRLRPPYRLEDGLFLDGQEGARVVANAHFDDLLLRSWDEDVALYWKSGGEAEPKTDRLEIESADGRQTVFLDRESGLDIRRLVWNEAGELASEITTEYGLFDERLLPTRRIFKSEDEVVEYVFHTYDFDSIVDPAAFDLESVRQIEAARAGGQLPE